MAFSGEVLIREAEAGQLYKPLVEYQGFYTYLMQEPILFSGTIRDNLISSDFDNDFSEEYVILLFKLLGAVNYIEVDKPFTDAAGVPPSPNLIRLADNKVKKLKVTGPIIKPLKKSKTKANGLDSAASDFDKNGEDNRSRTKRVEILY